MNRIVLASLLFPLFATLPASCASPAVPDPMPGQAMRVGDYRPTPVDQPLVQEARGFVQRKLPNLTLVEVTEAYTQVVAGLNVKLVSRVTDDEGTGDWEFVAFRGLNGTWHLTSATRL